LEITMICPGSPVRGIVAAILFLALGSAKAAVSFAPLPGLSLNPGDHYRFPSIRLRRR
jgi:hypothetical protein